LSVHYEVHWCTFNSVIS